MNRNTMVEKELAELVKSAVVTAGNGRGFVVQGTLARYVITAAHCLPNPFERVYEPNEQEKRSPFERVLGGIIGGFERAGRVFEPPPKPSQQWLPFLWQSVNNPIERVLGPIGQKPTVWARCVFLDPIADLAVLGSPGDYHSGHKMGKEYEALTNAASPLRISDVSEFRSGSRDDDDDEQPKETPVWLLSLTGEVIPCIAVYVDYLIGSAAVADTVGIRGGEIRRADGLPPQDLFPQDAAPMFGSPIVVADGSAIGLLAGYREGLRLTHHLPPWLLRELAQARRE